MPYTEMESNTALKLILIVKKAKAEPKLKFTSLAHYLDAEYLKECFGELKRRKAAGVDGRVVESYSDEEITQAIEELVATMKRKRYRPQPVRRTYIDKGNGKLRPLGIPTVLDKVLQLGMAKILSAIYEPIFLSVSYGFRKGRDPHECLKELNHVIMGKRVNWVIEADIKGFFDHVDHAWMMRCLDERISDPVFKDLIRRMLKAGVMEGGQITYNEAGTPQGGIISPLLANIYLHYVLDLWFEVEEKRALKGDVYLVRYADDFVICAQHEADGQKVLEDLRVRLQKFGLTLSEEKTGMREFGRYAEDNRRRRGESRPETFDFLGFTHYCARTRDGRFQVRVMTSRQRMNRAIVRLKEWIKSIRNRLKLSDIWKLLRMKLQGHYNYYGMSGNFEGIQRYYRMAIRLIFKWINRRSQKKSMNWGQFWEYLGKYPLLEPKLTYAIYNTW